jgi:deoxyribose-phosphate aldolase
MKNNFESIAKVIDHTLLRADTREDEIRILCKDGRQYGFASVCVPPAFVFLASKLLKDSAVLVGTVVGFPLGFYPTEIKLKQAELALRDGAQEIDMVMQIGSLKSGPIDFVRKDIQEITRLCHPKNVIVKVIIETCLLNETEKKTACRLVVEAGGDYVKTSTGYGACGATVSDVRLMKNAVKGSPVKVKASGGIRTYNQVIQMLKAGADRIGTSSGIRIMKEFK